jgi:hypothetical protein
VRRAAIVFGEASMMNHQPGCAGPQAILSDAGLAQT